jgi:hypothetical protein
MQVQQCWEPCPAAGETVGRISVIFIGEKYANPRDKKKLIPLARMIEIACQVD